MITKQNWSTLWECPCHVCCWFKRGWITNWDLATMVCRLKAPLLNVKKWLATYLIYVLIKNISFELLQKHFFYQSIYLHRSFGLLWIFYFYAKPMIYHCVLYTNGWQLLAVRRWIKRDRTHVIKGVSIVLLESASSLCKKLS